MLYKLSIQFTMRHDWITAFIYCEVLNKTEYFLVILTDFFITRCSQRSNTKKCLNSQRLKSSYDKACLCYFKSIKKSLFIFTVRKPTTSERRILRSVQPHNVGPYVLKITQSDMTGDINATVKSIQPIKTHLLCFQLITKRE